MKIIVGLGNPGTEYLYTRHNAGFLFVQGLAERYGIKCNKQGFHSSYGIGSINGKEVLVAKPQTYMNLSGQAVESLVSHFTAIPEKIIIAHDDLDFPPGKFKVKLGGRDAGHRGIRSITENLGTDQYQRLRIGIGRPPLEVPVVDYVLSLFFREEMILFNEIAKEMEDKVLECIEL